MSFGVALSSTFRRPVARTWTNRVIRRAFSAQTVLRGSYQSKYAEKLKAKAEQAGTSLEELKKKAKAEEEERRRQEGDKLRATFKPEASPENTGGTSVPRRTSSPHERKDAAPYKSLTSILNLPRLLSTPHTPEQISTLWTAYHASRSGGTGRGFICASIPLEMYQQMEKTGKRYPAFVVPIPRPGGEEIQTPEGGQTPHEFYFMEWAFHEAPPLPSATDDPFVVHRPGSDSGNPQVATVLFTPLVEYKLRNSFATPYLVLTMHTDLAKTHGIVLLRGEITPGTGATGDNYMLSQADAQLLAFALQKYYLWGQSEPTSRAQHLLSTFHDNPEAFDWKELLADSAKL